MNSDYETTGQLLSDEEFNELEEKLESSRSPECDHIGWSFEKHGRCCWKCGKFLLDFGD